MGKQDRCAVPAPLTTNGDASLILGAGPIGLMLVQACVAAGVESIVVAEPSASRRALAAVLGATTCIDPFSDSVVEVAHDVTGGRGVAAAFDAAAAPTSLDHAVASTRPRGTVVSIAAWERPAAFDPTTLLFRETAVRGSLAYTSADFDRAITYATDHAADLQRMVSRVIPLDEAVTEGFDRLASGAHDDVKVLVRPGPA